MVRNHLAELSITSSVKEAKPSPDSPSRPTSDEDRRSSHAHPHAHPHAHDGPADSTGFPHEKLTACQVALEMAILANKMAQQIPRGHRNVADHLLRAASNCVLLLAEGASRRGAAEKRQRFVESRGECGEVGAAGDLLLGFGIGSPAGGERLKQLASRV